MSVALLVGGLVEQMKQEKQLQTNVFKVRAVSRTTRIVFLSDRPDRFERCGRKWNLSATLVIENEEI